MTEKKMPENTSIQVSEDQRAPHPEDLLYKATPEGVAQLHPLYEAALAERLQYDGDVPELRTGPLPDGASPAVSVVTSAMDPAVIGEMLERASNKVKDQIAEAREKQGSLLIEMTTDFSHEILDVEEFEGGSLVAYEAETTQVTPVGIKGYMPGQIPAPMHLEAMPSSQLLSLSTDRRAELTWKCLSTTQGRRSAVGVIRKKVSQLLSRKGIEVIEGAPGEESDLEAEWFILLDGPKSIQPRFPYIGAACSALARKAERCPKRLGRGRALLKIKTLDNYSQGEVGWQMILKWTR